ncbi:MAG: hypothetical protein HY788_16070 [Deltaproteobacteria bacterium]|nr:hypothetical protein [Deltaproteobacteria bacterium]
MFLLGFVSISIVLVLFAAGEAHAYLDAGSGSMLIQIILGGAAGLVVILKLFWRRILEVLGIAKQDTN